MKKFTLLFCLVLSTIFLRAQTTWVQYASKVIDFSSQYTTENWSARQALGTPNTSGCGDIPTSWASLSADGQREYLVLGFIIPGKANQVRIFQNNAPGAIDTVYLHDAGTNTWNTIYSATASALTCTGTPTVLQIDFPTTSYRVDAVRIALNSPAVPGWNEIDAVTLQTESSATVKVSAQSGNWNNVATWAGGIVPVAADTVVIDTGHTISENVTTNIKSLYINSGAELDMGSVALILGPNGGGKEFLNVYGTLKNPGGNIVVNGNAEFFNGSTFNMSGGHIYVDGNNGTAGGSVANGVNLLQFDPGMSNSFTSGTITITDPQFNASGQAVSGNYTFGNLTSLELGDNLSTQASNNLRGFGGADSWPSFGTFYMDAVTSAGNRYCLIGNYMRVQINLVIGPGSTLIIAATDPTNAVNQFIVNSNVTNSGTISNLGYFQVDNNLTNAGTISVDNVGVTVGKNFTNNPGAVYQTNSASANTSVGQDLVNNGSFQAHYLYFSNHFFSASTNTQSVSGSGSFDIYGLNIFNSSTNGITLLVPLSIQELFFTTGKLFLGNNDLTVALDNPSSSTPGASSYVVTNGTGKLIMQNVTSTRLFPIGNSDYTPVSIGNGSGHSFSASVRNSFTAALPSAPVQREWNLTDITGGAVSATVTMQWNAPDEDPSFTRNLCYVGHYNGSNWDPVSSGGSASGTGPYTRTATGVTSFSPFGVFSGGSILPVHLLNFSAVQEGDQVKLSWQVDNETDMTGYEVERSTNARNFTKLSALPAINQLVAHSYSVYDAQPPAGIVYYRLKELNKDGRIVYSSIAQVEINGSNVFVYPNPATNKIKVKGLNHFTSAALTDVNGRTIQQWRIGSGEQLDVSRISPGVYQLILVNDNDRRSVQITIAI